jgi:dTDP-glucose pyrophosphorylase
MIVLIPMAGAGQRFVDAGYLQRKPVIPTTDRKTGRVLPMVVNAISDLPFDRSSDKNYLILMMRDEEIVAGVGDEVRRHFPSAEIRSVASLTEGQACTCLLARDAIDVGEELLIAACDNGMDLPEGVFEEAVSSADAVIFTFRNNEAVKKNPKAYGWVRVEADRAIGVSIKTPISDHPESDHAVVGTFWFKRGSDFVRAADKMMRANDRINGEFYVDQIFKYLIESGLCVRVLEIERYVCWGTPSDYETYENTIRYWREFLSAEIGL